jgi:hypothetical protein
MGVTSSVHIHGDDPQHATQGAAEAFVANLNRTVQSVGPNPLLMAAAMDPAFGREMAAAIGEAASAERARRSAAPAEPQTSQPQPIYPPDAQPPTELQAAEPLEVVVRLLPAEPTSQPQANTAEPDAEPHAESQAVEPHTEPQTTAMDELERDAAVKSAAREKAAAEARTAALEAAEQVVERAKLRSFVCPGGGGNGYSWEQDLKQNQIIFQVPVERPIVYKTDVKFAVTAKPTSSARRGCEVRLATEMMFSISLEVHGTKYLEGILGGPVNMLDVEFACTVSRHASGRTSGLVIVLDTPGTWDGVSVRRSWHCAVVGERPLPPPLPPSPLPPSPPPTKAQRPMSPVFELERIVRSSSKLTITDLTDDVLSTVLLKVLADTSVWYNKDNPWYNKRTKLAAALSTTCKSFHRVLNAKDDTLQQWKTCLLCNVDLQVAAPALVDELPFSPAGPCPRFFCCDGQYLCAPCAEQSPVCECCDTIACPACWDDNCLNCSGCGRDIQQGCHTDIDTCARCNENLCDDCGEVRWCVKCDEHLCESCEPMVYRVCCGECMCDDCDPAIECDVCGQHSCQECREEDYECEFCGDTYCPECVYRCDGCSTVGCSDCLSLFEGSVLQYCTQCADGIRYVMQPLPVGWNQLSGEGGVQFWCAQNDTENITFIRPTQPPAPLVPPPAPPTEPEPEAESAMVVSQLLRPSLDCLLRGSHALHIGPEAELLPEQIKNKPQQPSMPMHPPMLSAAVEYLRPSDWNW